MKRYSKQSSLRTAQGCPLGSLRHNTSIILYTFTFFLAASLVYWAYTKTRDIRLFICAHVILVLVQQTNVLRRWKSSAATTKRVQSRAASQAFSPRISTWCTLFRAWMRVHRELTLHDLELPNSFSSKVWFYTFHVPACWNRCR